MPKLALLCVSVFILSACSQPKWNGFYRGSGSIYANSAWLIQDEAAGFYSDGKVLYTVKFSDLGNPRELIDIKSGVNIGHFDLDVDKLTWCNRKGCIDFQRNLNYDRLE